MPNSEGSHPLRLGLLGGSFNPPHVGHLRMAIEVREALNLTRVDLVPAAMQPLKHGGEMLPFADRVPAILEAWLLGQAGGAATAPPLNAHGRQIQTHRC